MNEEVHQAAIDAIGSIPDKHRLHSQVVTALDSAVLPQLKTGVVRAINTLRSLAACGGEKDDVYQIEISVFPLTRIKAQKKEKQSGEKKRG
jgi:hypothetical protein